MSEIIYPMKNLGLDFPHTHEVKLDGRYVTEFQTRLFIVDAEGYESCGWRVDSVEILAGDDWEPVKNHKKPWYAMIYHDVAKQAFDRTSALHHSIDEAWHRAMGTDEAAA